MINIVLPLISLIILGYLLRSKATEQTKTHLNQFIYYIALPSLLFTKMFSFPNNWGDAISQIIIIYSATIIISLILLFLDIPKRLKPSFIMASYRGNIAYLGLPIVTMIFDQGAIASIVIAATIPLYVLVSIILLKAKKGIKQILLNPLILAVIAGFGARNLIPLYLISPLELIAGLSLPLSLILLGLSISFKKRFLPATLSSMIKLLILPFIGLILSLALRIKADLAIILLAMPTAITAYSFAKELDGDTRFTSTQISLSTILATITIPLILFLLRNI